MQVIERALEASKARDPQAEQFHQAAREVLTSIEPLLKAEPALAQGSLLQRLIEPERQIIFRVPWRDDDGEVQVSRGFRIEHNSALGPYKGGLRFRPGLKVDELRFLAFEQTFKNALTQMPLGAGKGGADVDLRGASDEMLMGFCQSFMTELHRHIGLYTDVPAGDIGVGSKAIGYLFGQYKRLSKHMTPPLTGKPLESGGIPMREEATGFGAVYFAQHMAKDLDGDLSGKRCVVSGAGNVALHAAKKLIEIGATVVAMSDSKGSIHKSSGLSADDLEGLMACKAEGGSVGDWAKDSSADFEKGSSVWGLSLKMDAAFPCAFQNEIDGEAAKAIASGGCEMVVEGANMPCTAEATISTTASTSSPVIAEPRFAVNTTVALAFFSRRANTFSFGNASSTRAFLMLAMSSIVAATCISRACLRRSISTRCDTPKPISCMMMSLPACSACARPSRLIPSFIF